ncbi:G-type lectin S-receptor-like serine/threonine-protein kinase SD2-5 [Apium graveolens]|uniref:G-type lectin S-receptor-like serine/threonine-protein kinase SD2-5 n=1 Tax=Apium graveolens TaxID=4045 RepID=UPI003D79FF05
MMGTWAFLNCIGLCLLILFQPETCLASVRFIGSLKPGYQGDQMHWIDNNGLFLLSNNSDFAFGFTTTPNDVTLFVLAVVHASSSTTVWSANRGAPVKNSDLFMFNESGNASLQSGGSIIWSTNTANKGVSFMELQNSGNLVLVGDDGSIIWQSFSHPTDTLLSNQDFSEGMKLVSDPGSNNLSYFLEMKSGDMLLYADFEKPQPYWSMGQDNRKTINKIGASVTVASIEANSWRFSDKNKILLWQFIFSNSATNSTWAATLGSDGYITFYTLEGGTSSNNSPTKIPADSCSRPQACDPYQICGSSNCQCPTALASKPNCRPDVASPCNRSKGSMELADAGFGLSYFALGFAPPSSKTDLNGCKSSCLDNCSCLLMFFENKSGNCFHFDHVGSLQSSKESGYISYIKISSTDGNGGDSSGSGSSKKHVVIVAVIVIMTTLVILVLLFAGVRYFKKSNVLPESPKENSEEDNFLESISGMPVRFSYKDLQVATKDFSAILGRGGFGSVYEGVLKDGTRLAVKQLEGLGQGKKEFQAEVSIIGSIHHLHLVRLKGFCAEGTHKLLVYEFMANNSLDKWLFKRNKAEMLDWDTRYNIALGTAKGLAYLHEDCDVKIVHCDIKPENVLLDDNFLAKVSDFGLAKLMSREQSHVFTTLRGTRGYLAPEWITNYAISEKSDVYSYGMVLLEIIGGRKNYDASETSEKSHFPSYAFKMMEEGKLTDIVDAHLEMAKTDERVMVAIKVALWCIQDDMSHRPSMTKVVQMLEGLSPVPPPPMSSQLNSRLYSNFCKSVSEEGTSSAPSDCNSDAYLSAVRLSGPR